MLRRFREVGRVIDEVLGFVFQTVCAVCGRSGVAATLCPKCLPIHPIEGTLCPVCGDVIAQPMERCGACLDRGKQRLARARSLLWLTDEARPLVHRVKYGRRFELLDVFRPALSFLDVDFSPDAVLLPVPLHPSKLTARGFNQAEILASWLAKDLGMRTLLDGLEKSRAGKSQASLTRAQRLKNLRGGFRWRSRRPPPAKIVLVDDIYTTGSTLEACAKALIRAGADEVCAWTLFRTPLLISRGRRVSEPTESTDCRRP